MVYLIIVSVFCLIHLLMMNVSAFSCISWSCPTKIGARYCTKVNMIMHPLTPHSTFPLPNSFPLLSDTSISEEDVLDVVGQTTDLPDPIYAIVFATVVFAGVAFLQFSLGDLTKEEGQARVRDFLQTKQATERKRGYFDD